MDIGHRHRTCVDFFVRYEKIRHDEKYPKYILGYCELSDKNTDRMQTKKHTRDMTSKWFLDYDARTRHTTWDDHDD